MQGNEIRASFLKYFEEKGHEIVPSSPLVPDNDPTLLFTNAGMVQFKEVFLGIEKRNYKKAVTSQKCVRAGGKHNDLDTVGRTPRHHTFFEMLGNFSFGDYFKREAIEYCWEYLTDRLKLPPEKLWASVYEKDDEAFSLWKELTDIPEERIIKLGEKDNFWALGDTGPCGPCSEVIYDRGVDYSCGHPECGMDVCECDRWLEVWNLVFMQYEKDESGNLNPLPSPSIDTGMGLERIASLMQGVESNFQSDLIRPIIDKVEEMTGEKFYDDNERGFPFRVIADHARACSFLISDGVLPGNEGRGYVLKRILRRAVRYGRTLGLEEPFLYKLVDVVAGIMGHVYSELREKQATIEKIIKVEEEKFNETIYEGTKMVTDILEKAEKESRNRISGDEAFMLYDTFGFPIDLTQDIAAEYGMEVDIGGFESAMEKQRERARLAQEGSKGWNLSAAFSGSLKDLGASEFVGYDNYIASGKVLALARGEELIEKAEAGKEVALIADQTPCYPEGGGQVGDKGFIESTSGKMFVYDTEMMHDGKIVHKGEIQEGFISVSSDIKIVVDEIKRKYTAKNHSATHLLHKAFKEILGEHINQSGSYVSPERLRFDFTHFEALSSKEIKEIENHVNENIYKALPVIAFTTSMDEAKKMGAIALFGEKYSENVRAIKIGDHCIELCGGTHVENTIEIGIFKILSESSIGSGVRRVEAVTGMNAVKYLNDVEEKLNMVAEKLKTSPSEVMSKVEQLTSELKDKEKEVQQLEAQLIKYKAQDFLSHVKEVNGINLLTVEVDSMDIESLRNVGDILKNKIESGVIVLGTADSEKANFIAMATEDVVGKGIHAGNLVKEVAKVTKGGGGGRPNMAQAGGSDPSKLQEALKKAEEIVASQLEG